MKWLYQSVARPILFQLKPEEAHEQTLNLLARVSHHPSLRQLVQGFCESPLLPTEIDGLQFTNPVGLAAGMDKNAVALPAWESLGFGFCEIGGITQHAQPGNPKPRMFRSPDTEALINRMGFNNEGLDSVSDRLSTWKRSGNWPSSPVAINLGKSKITPLEEAPEEYAHLLSSLWPFGDFFIVNVSSPNTPDLRKLQHVDALKRVIDALQQSRSDSMEKYPELPVRPIFLKIDPDMPLEALNEVLDVVQDSILNGIVATNTTLSRSSDSNKGDVPEVYNEQGGLSGLPLKDRSTKLIRHIREYTHGKLVIIGVGGIFSPQDAWEKIVAGASLLQVYSGLVYQGPLMIQEIVQGLIDQLELHGLDKLDAAVGKELAFKDY